MLVPPGGVEPPHFGLEDQMPDPLVRALATPAGLEPAIIRSMFYKNNTVSLICQGTDFLPF